MLLEISVEATHGDNFGRGGGTGVAVMETLAVVEPVENVRQVLRLRTNIRFDQKLNGNELYAYFVKSDKNLSVWT